MFNLPQGRTAEERESGNTKMLTGTGTPYLEAPGLKQVTGVRVGITQIPLEIRTEHPADASDRPRLITIPHPMVMVMPDENGVPILLRSILSNDGVWQKDVPIYVTGEWSDEAPRRGRQ